MNRNIAANFYLHRAGIITDKEIYINGREIYIYRESRFVQRSQHRIYNKYISIYTICSYLLLFVYTVAKLATRYKLVWKDLYLVESGIGQWGPTARLPETLHRLTLCWIENMFLLTHSIHCWVHFINYDR